MNYYGATFSPREDYIQHHGILGQKWGVRRFQNEDGTLTPEGRERYLNGYADAEKDATRRIEQARRQIEDLKKNGWNAKSVFAPGFVNKYAKDLGVKKEDLPKEDLDFFMDVYKDDLAVAELDLKSAREAKSFIEKNQNITYDQILDKTFRIDKNSKSGSAVKRNEEAKKIADEMGLKTKEKGDTVNVVLDFKDYTPDTERKLKEAYPSNKDVKATNKEIYDFLHSNKIDQYVDIDDLKKKSDYEQCWALMNLMAALFK